MLLQHLTTKQYALLPSGVLIVEPDPELLAARVLLLSAADFDVGLWEPEQPSPNELDTVVVVAVLSLNFGKTRSACRGEEYSDRLAKRIDTHSR